MATAQPRRYAGTRKGATSARSAPPSSTARRRRFTPRWMRPATAGGSISSPDGTAQRRPPADRRPSYTDFVRRDLGGVGCAPPQSQAGDRMYRWLLLLLVAAGISLAP